MLSMPFFSYPKLRYDQSTKRYYSTPSAHDINQDDYHNMVLECLILIANKPYSPEEALVGAFVSLKAIATPTALRLKKDLEELVKTTTKERKKLGQLLK